jgi:hypothetical protein
VSDPVGCGANRSNSHPFRGICPDCGKGTRFFATFTVPGVGDCDFFATITVPRPMTEDEYKTLLKYLKVTKPGLVYEREQGPLKDPPR